MRFAQLIMGPAGSGKSTYCNVIRKHAEAMNRVINVVNIDPAADHFDYDCVADIRDLIHVHDVMKDEQLHYGPNGGLIFCMEYLIDHLDWLEEIIGTGEDDYILIDCPGQIELYTHVNVMKRLTEALASWNFRVCGVFLLDTQFMLEMSKFFSGALVALSAMINLEIPHVNILTKMDLLNKKNKKLVERFLMPDSSLLLDDDTLDSQWNKKYKKLTKALATMMDDYSLLKFLTLDVTDEGSIDDVLLCIDNAVQYGEDVEVKMNYPDEMDENEDDRAMG